MTIPVWHTNLELNTWKAPLRVKLNLFCVLNTTQAAQSKTH